MQFVHSKYGIKSLLKIVVLTFRGANGRTGEGRLQKYQLNPELQFRILPCQLMQSGWRLRTSLHAAGRRLPTYIQLIGFIEVTI